MEDTGLTEPQWQAAYAIAQKLVEAQMRINPKEKGVLTELKKVISYARSICTRADAGEHLFKYLDSLVKYGHQISHSKSTPGYYHAIQQHCSTYLRPFQQDPTTLLLILGWTARLWAYIQEGGSIGEINAPPATGTTQIKKSNSTVQQLEITPPESTSLSASGVKFYVGERHEAMITRISRVKVTFEVLGQKGSQSEHKLATKLREGQVVQVEIVEVHNDGRWKRLKVVQV